MGALHLVPGFGGGGATDCTCSHFERSTRVERRKASLVRILAIMLGFLVFFACHSEASATKNDRTAVGNFVLGSGQSAEREKITNFTTSAFVSGHCSKASYDHGSDYHYNVNELFAKLIEKINVNVAVWEDASDAYDNVDTVYGLAGCSNLTAVNCKLCLGNIVKNLEDWCPLHALTAEIILEACFLHYDNYYIKVPVAEGAPST